jgi:hypothetical protein
MAKDELVRLAERCEAATGPDATLNADILETIADERWRQLEYEASLPCGAPPDMIRKEARYKAGIRFPFTASLDAAMTLVPEGCSFRLYSHGDENHADVFRLGEITDNGVTLDRITTELGEAEMCKTPALAVCVAALYARAALRARSPERNTDV